MKQQGSGNSCQAAKEPCTEYEHGIEPRQQLLLPTKMGSLSSPPVDQQLLAVTTGMVIRGIVSRIESCGVMVYFEHHGVVCIAPLSCKASDSVQVDQQILAMVREVDPMRLSLCPIIPISTTATIATDQGNAHYGVEDMKEHLIPSLLVTESESSNIFKPPFTILNDPICAKNESNNLHVSPVQQIQSPIDEVQVEGTENITLGSESNRISSESDSSLSFASSESSNSSFHSSSSRSVFLNFVPSMPSFSSSSSSSSSSSNSSSSSLSSSSSSSSSWSSSSSTSSTCLSTSSECVESSESDDNDMGISQSLSSSSQSYSSMDIVHVGLLSSYSSAQSLSSIDVQRIGLMEWGSLDFGGQSCQSENSDSSLQSQSDAEPSSRSLLMGRLIGLRSRFSQLASSSSSSSSEGTNSDGQLALQGFQAYDSISSESSSTGSSTESNDGWPSHNDTSLIDRVVTFRATVRRLEDDLNELEAEALQDSDVSLAEVSSSESSFDVRGESLDCSIDSNLISDDESSVATSDCSIESSSHSSASSKGPESSYSDRTDSSWENNEDSSSPSSYADSSSSSSSSYSNDTPRTDMEMTASTGYVKSIADERLWLPVEHYMGFPLMSTLLSTVCMQNLYKQATVATKQMVFVGSNSSSSSSMDCYGTVAIRVQQPLALPRNYFFLYHDLFHDCSTCASDSSWWDTCEEGFYSATIPTVVFSFPPLPVEHSVQLPTFE